MTEVPLLLKKKKNWEELKNLTETKEIIRKFKKVNKQEDENVLCKRNL